MSLLEREVETFDQAARWVGGVVSRIGTKDWDGAGLGEWSLRALVGHTSRALLTVEQYLDRPADTEEVRDAIEYFERAAAPSGADPSAAADAIRQRGVDAGSALGDDPSAEFHAIVERVTTRVTTVPDALILTLVGGMRLSQYLPTRIFELVVHGLDIAGATGQGEIVPPDPALQRALQIAAGLAARSGDGPRALLALTGRTGLPDGFSVLA